MGCCWGYFSKRPALHKLRSQDITPVTLVCTNFIIAWCQPRYGSKIETKSQAKVINMLAIWASAMVRVLWKTEAFPALSISIKRPQSRLVSRFEHVLTCFNHMIICPSKSFSSNPCETKHPNAAIPAAPCSGKQIWKSGTFQLGSFMLYLLGWPEWKRTCIPGET